MKLFLHSAKAAIAVGLLSFASVPHSAAEMAPDPGDPSAFPPFGQCTTASIPGLPDSWSSNVLLTPFESQPLQVARVSSGNYKNARYMLAVTDNVPNTTSVAWLTVSDFGGNGDTQIFQIIDGADGNLQCSPAQFPKSADINWTAPEADFLSDANCICMGSNDVAGVEADAWRCPNGQRLRPGVEAYDWFWYSQDSNPEPVRYLFSRPNNKQDLPVLGNAAMNHFTAFSDSANDNIHRYFEACNDAVVTAQLPQPNVEGVVFNQDTAQRPPIWPDTAFSNGALFAIDGTYTSMAIYYDWTTLQEVTKILSSDADLALYPHNPRLADTRLTEGRTYQVSYDQNGQRVFPETAKESLDGGILGNVGIWRPDWARHDNCQYKATIQPGSPLNPNRDEPLKALSCFFAQHIGGAESNIQAWYTYSDEPVMFYETNAGDLDLIDYTSWLPDAEIPDGVLYDIPTHVQHLPPAMMTDCNACHGKISH